MTKRLLREGNRFRSWNAARRELLAVPVVEQELQLGSAGLQQSQLEPIRVGAVLRENVRVDACCVTSKMGVRLRGGLPTRRSAP
jgi:hypothetical protein